MNFDKQTKMCKIYDRRPEFCRIEKKKYIDLYELDDNDFTVSPYLRTFLKY